MITSEEFKIFSVFPFRHGITCHINLTFSGYKSIPFTTAQV